MAFTPFANFLILSFSNLLIFPQKPNQPLPISQGAALILFKFCLISEAQPHPFNPSTHTISSFPHSLISSFPYFLIPLFCTKHIVKNCK
ncbi:hypothetical protein HMPREF9072_01220 [Capnocytophaga sp. oral taxon 324 str. F0483]|nr:hypothetical protein HMPREF9072_01220 [Capnocytophaga sp. oral taxon 324 str. F0483]